MVDAVGLAVRYGRSRFVKSRFIKSRVVKSKFVKFRSLKFRSVKSHSVGPGAVKPESLKPESVKPESVKTGYSGALQPRFLDVYACEPIKQLSQPLSRSLRSSGKFCGFGEGRRPVCRALCAHGC